jgi:hypothetical protein
MALTALCSWSGAPGVTTATLALALRWPGPVIAAECDPRGGQILAGYAQGRIPAGRGLTQLAQTGALSEQLVGLDDSGTRWLLPGLDHPGESDTVNWTWLSELLTAAGHPEAPTPAEVLADCGRLHPADGSTELLRRAHLAVLVVTASPPTLFAAHRAVPLLREQLGHDRLVALVTGTGPHRHPISEIERFFAGVGLPVAAHLRLDPPAAAVLSEGAPTGRGWTRSPLMRDAAEAGERLRHYTRAHGPSPVAPSGHDHQPDPAPRRQPAVIPDREGTWR